MAKPSPDTASPDTAKPDTAKPNPADTNVQPGNTASVSAPFETVKGSGGETQQLTTDKAARLTTNHGTPLSDNQNSLKAGARGPTLLEDFILREKIFHFDHERIPERIVHARGSAAHGVFEVTDAITDLTRAALFQQQGSSCEVFVRFSTVAGGAGSVDTPRDIRGFAVKFYTPEGNWDLVGNDTPVFFIQDAMKFPDLVHSVKMEADRGYPQAASAHDTFWDFVSQMPETLHNVTWAMSDRGIPRSLRFIEGFGIHTFRMINAEGKSSFIRFVWKPRLGVQSVLWDESLKLQAADNDFHRRDLYEAIDAGDFPQWDLGLQVIDPEWAARQPYDVLDATKLIPEEEIPLRIVGTLTLNRNPDNHFAENEQVAFLPSNVPPGIDFSDDPLLAGRLFSYLDTQKSRLGTTNFHQIPINAPRCPMHNFQRDGMMQTEVPKGRANYELNTLVQAGEVGGPRADATTGFRTTESMTDLGNQPDGKLRVRSETFADHFSQPRMYFRSLSENEQAHTIAAFVFELSKVSLVHVREGVLALLRNVDEGMAKRVADGLAMDLPAAATPARAPVDLPVADSLSIQKNAGKAAPKGRKLGIVVTDGIDGAVVEGLKSAAKAAGAAVELVGQKIGGVTLADGSKLAVDGQLAGSPSVVFDGVAIVASADGAAMLARDAAALGFLADAWAHLKAIAATDEARGLLDKANVGADDFVVAARDADAVVSKLAQRNWAREPEVRPLP